jgi:RNA polymerase sigma-70 factor (ECF subfamily)
VPRQDLDTRLSQISTVWTVLRQAHGGSDDVAGAARRLLLERYGPAVRRYLGAVLGDPHAADELTQEFAVALLRGDFRKADPERGQFRHYVKGVLFNLVGNYRRGRAKQPRPLPADEVAAAEAPAGTGAFDESWRGELLARTWAALAEAQPTYHAVLRFRAEHPKMGSEEMAERLSERLDRPLTPDGVRQTLHRARERFADLLLDEVARSLREPTRQRVEEELAELRLLEYCRPALGRRR